ncbi:MAG: tetratricopeptide repeat protein [Chthoniobacteraceae bacterium]|jgi:Flp pilus assembly protein TadD
MPVPPASAPPRPRLLWPALLCLSLLAAYSNHFHNAFHFDDSHTISENLAIRDLANIPRFFTGAAPFSVLPGNQSYRPLVSTLLAIDYSLARGLNPLPFHLSIFILFAALTLLVALFIQSLLDTPLPSPYHAPIALAAAAWYGLHPANADTVNYVIASSEVISTLGVLASFAIYILFPRLRPCYLFALPAAIAILAKPPAAVFVLLFALYRWLYRDPAPLLPSLISWAKDILPPFILCAAASLLVQRMTPPTWVAGASSAHDYLITQPYVALLYFKTFLWPSGLSADYGLDPITSTHDPRFWSGCLFVLLFLAATISFCLRKSTRAIGFGFSWFVIALLPTSLFPLAEAMNDHRTFFPYIGLVIAAAGAAALLLGHAHEWTPRAKSIAAFVACLFLGANGYATFQRNKAWLTEETLWRDVTLKNPSNARSLMNYGNTLMARGDFIGALSYFNHALLLAPQYPVLLINLAIVEDAIGQPSLAEQHFQRALRLDPSSPTSFTYYARYLIARGRSGEAGALLNQALLLSPDDTMARDLLSRPTSAPQSPEAFLTLSLQLYRDGDYPASIDACRKALALHPDYAAAWNNIGAAYNQLGQYDQAAAACKQALRIDPAFDLARNNLLYAEKMAAAH